MRETIDSLLSLNDLHWRGNAYQWFFYAAILLVLIFEKRKTIRIVFGWAPVLYLALMFNPICIKALNLAGLSNPAYFARLFSFMPLMYVIARGFTILLMTRNNWIKLVGVCLTCTVICLTGKNIYGETWLTKADNLEKVPQETLDILEAIDADENQNVSIAPIDASAVYIRQVADVITPYGRNVGGLGRLLEMDPPDAQQVMEKAGFWCVDYVMVHRTDSTISAFEEQGYEPYALTENYALFKVEGVPRIKQILNENRQIVSESYYDETGELAVTGNGYTTILYEYGPTNQVDKQSYYDVDGNQFCFPEGYTSVRNEHYTNGKTKSLAYLDKNGNPVLKDGRCETRYRYDSSGRVVQETYYDEQGKPMKRMDGEYAMRRITYLEGSTVERYYDEVGEPVFSAGGYAGKKTVYDGENQLTEVIYYDSEGNEIGGAGGGRAAEDQCLTYYERTCGAAIDDNGAISFETSIEDNRINAVWFQLYNAVTGEYLFNFGQAYGPIEVHGEYTHQLPSGLYRLVFKCNTNLKDESISSLEYLTEGEILNYRYYVDEFQDKEVKIQNFYIGRENRAFLSDLLIA